MVQGSLATASQSGTRAYWALTRSFIQQACTERLSGAGRCAGAGHTATKALGPLRSRSVHSREETSEHLPYVDRAGPVADTRGSEGAWKARLGGRLEEAGRGTKLELGGHASSEREQRAPNPGRTAGAKTEREHLLEQMGQPGKRWAAGACGSRPGRRGAPGGPEPGNDAVWSAS